MKNKYLTLSVFVLSLIGSILMFGVDVSAADPGCYVRSSFADGVSIDPANCPADNRDVSDGVDAGLCYVAPAGSSGIGNFSPIECNSFQVGRTSSAGDGSRDTLSRGECEPDEGEELNRDNCGIIDIVVTAINFLSALAGIVIIGSIMFAGYQYMTARDNPQTVQAARIRVVWALVALALFVFMYALLNFLIPGGVL